MRLTQFLPLALAGAIAAPALSPALAPALAQSTDLQLLREITDAMLLAPTGAELGQIGDVLIDESGRPVAVAVEVDDAYVELDEQGRVFLLEDLIYRDGNYLTSLTPAEIEALPPYDD